MVGVQLEIPQQSITGSSAFPQEEIEILTDAVGLPPGNIFCLYFRALLTSTRNIAEEKGFLVVKCGEG